MNDFIRTTRILLITISLIFIGSASKAQHALAPGANAAHIVIRGVSNYTDSVLRVSDLAGKYVLLDFWSTGCATCINKMPLMDSLQTEFNDDIQIVLVNTNESKAKADERLRKIEQRLKRGRIIPENLPSAIGDTALNDVFPHITVPHHVWIGPNGDVLYITNGYNTTRENVAAVIAGKGIAAKWKKDLPHIYFKSRTLADWVAENALTPIVRSDDFLLIPYQEEMEGPAVMEGILDTAKQEIRFTYPNVSLPSLYRFAYQDHVYGSQFSINTNRFLFANRWVIRTEQRGWAAPPKDYKDVDSWKTHANFSCELVVSVEDSNHFQDRLKERLDQYVEQYHGLQVRKKKIETACVLFSRLETGNLDYGDVALRSYRGFSSYVTSLYYMNRSLFDGLEIPIIVGFEDELVQLQLPEPQKYTKIEELNTILNRFGYEVKITRKCIDMMVVEDLYSQ